VLCLFNLDKLPWDPGRGAGERGLGDNLDFVGAFGRIKRLKSVGITSSLDVGSCNRHTI
jgi:hypothetical protein